MNALEAAWIRELECSVEDIVRALKGGVMPVRALADVAAHYTEPTPTEWAAILDAARSRYAHEAQRHG